MTNLINYSDVIINRMKNRNEENYYRLINTTSVNLLTKNLKPLWEYIDCMSKYPRFNLLLNYLSNKIGYEEIGYDDCLDRVAYKTLLYYIIEKPHVIENENSVRDELFVQELDWRFEKFKIDFDIYDLIIKFRVKYDWEGYSPCAEFGASSKKTSFCIKTKPVGTNIVSQSTNSIIDELFDSI